MLNPIAATNPAEIRGFASSTIRDRLYELISGEPSRPRRTSARIAWDIENALHRAGWPIGTVIGSEHQIANTFAVGRELFREALRIGERHGALRMQRGRCGGIVVASPSLSGSAMLLHTYFVARRCTEAHWRQVAPILEPDMVDSVGQVFISIVARARDLAVIGADGLEDSFGESPCRASKLASLLLEETAARHPSELQWRLGSEWDLGSLYGASRPVLRQALRILEDLDMLEMRRGRGGGILVKEPGRGAIARQFFPVLASSRISPEGLSAAIWRLNRLNMELTAKRLARSSTGARDAFIREAQGLSKTLEPFRWIAVQQLISTLAENPIIDTLLRCLVSYQARQDQVAPRLTPPECVSLLQSETELVAGLAYGCMADALAASGNGERILDAAWRRANGHRDPPA